MYIKAPLPLPLSLSPFPLPLCIPLPARNGTLRCGHAQAACAGCSVWPPVGGQSGSTASHSLGFAIHRDF